MELVKEIVKEQSLIIGENLARQMAIESGVVKFNSSKIDDLTVTEPNRDAAIEKLIGSYKELFGQASVEVCMNVIKKFPQKK